MQPGRPRIYRTNAERKRAWRQRQQPARARKARPKTNAERQRAWRKRQKTKVYHRRQTVEWETPQAVFDPLHAEFSFTLDVAAQPGNAKCPRFFTPKDNGLAQPWIGVCWMNPPYGRQIAAWMRKAYDSALQGATVVCLVPARTDTRWWHTYTQHGEIRYVQGRLTFGGAANPAPFPNAIVIFRPPVSHARAG